MLLFFKTVHKNPVFLAYFSTTIVPPKHWSIFLDDDWRCIAFYFQEAKGSERPSYPWLIRSLISSTFQYNNTGELLLLSSSNQLDKSTVFDTDAC